MAGQAPPQGPITDLRSMEELLQAPTNGVGDAIIYENNSNGAARTWLEKEPSNSITTWNDLVSKFVNHFFPPSKTTNPHNEITRFQQRFGETFAEAWDRFKDILNKCPHHGFSPLHQIDTFYNILSQADQDSLNSAVGLKNHNTNMSNKMDQIQKVLMERPQEVLPSNTVPNPQEDLKAITTLSGFTLVGPSVPPPPLSSSKEVDRELETITDPILTKSTTSVPPPVVQSCPASTELLPVPVSSLVISEPNPHQPVIPYPSSFAEALAHMPKFTKMVKDLLTNKEKLLEMVTIPLNENCSAVILKKLPEKLGDTGRFHIPCDFYWHDSCMALADLAGIAEDVFVQVEKFTFPFDFVVVDYDDEELVFNVESTSKYPRKHGDESIHKIDILDITCEDHFYEVLNVQKSINPMSGSPTPSPDPVVESLSPSLTPFGDSDFLLEETDTFLSLDDSIPPGINNGIYDSKGDILFLEELVNEDPTPNLPPISHHSLGEPDSCRTQKRGVTVITNENNELIPTRLVTGWRVCVDYRKLNDATRKDHFPLLFMDQMLEHLAGNEFYCFLDGFSGYFQISIDPQDQDKTTFTCPYGTFAYRRMPFGLCNAPGTFQRCMVAIFHDMIEKTMEVFMHDFSVYGDSFSSCLSHLDMMLKWCEDTNLDLSFKLMCDASDYAVGVVLGQRKNKYFRPIQYASKTLSDAQINYTVTEKELLVMVYAFKNFRSYLVLSKTILYTDHSTLKYLFNKQHAKPRLLRWILLLQEFTIEICDKKEAENLAADHLSRLENPYQGDRVGMEINDNFPYESLNMISLNLENEPSWFADIANYLVGNVLVKRMSSQQKKKFFKDI
nr:hypothetical protein [Tanacetum cinerariifolium]